jgi:hypothetical protein
VTGSNQNLLLAEEMTSFEIINLGKNQNMVMGPDGNRNQDLLCSQSRSYFRLAVYRQAVHLGDKLFETHD